MAVLRELDFTNNPQSFNINDKQQTTHLLKCRALRLRVMAFGCCLRFLLIWLIRHLSKGFIMRWWSCFSSSHVLTSLAERCNTFPFDKAFVSRLHCCLRELTYEQYIKYRQLKQHSVDLILKGMHSSRKSHRDQKQRCWRIIVYSLREFTGRLHIHKQALTMMFYFPKNSDCALELLHCWTFDATVDFILGT